MKFGQNQFSSFWVISVQSQKTMFPKWMCMYLLDVNWSGVFILLVVMMSGVSVRLPCRPRTRGERTGELGAVSVSTLIRNNPSDPDPVLLCRYLSSPLACLYLSGGSGFLYSLLPEVGESAERTEWGESLALRWWLSSNLLILGLSKLSFSAEKLPFMISCRTTSDRQSSKLALAINS